MKNDKLLPFLSLAALAHIILLMTTYNEFKEFAKIVIDLLSIIGSLLAIYIFLKKE
ncbi:MAG: hypothetical protein KBA66_18505 [Leptospiraceae bacterium]|nr:hypothetical protein [Leptospiraceae bacterium]